MNARELVSYFLRDLTETAYRLLRDRNLARGGGKRDKRFFEDARAIPDRAQPTAQTPSALRLPCLHLRLSAVTDTRRSVRHYRMRSCAVPSAILNRARFCLLADLRGSVTVL